MYYATIVDLYESLAATSKRLQKTWLVAQFLKRVPTQDLAHVVLLMQGRVFPLHDDRTIGVAVKLVLKAIGFASGTTTEKVEAEWKKKGDLGESAEILLKKRRQQSLGHHDLGCQEIVTVLQKLASVDGAGSVERKLKMISDLLVTATPVEAKYLVRMVLEDLRIGLGEGGMRDAIVWSACDQEIELAMTAGDITIGKREEYDKIVQDFQRAYDITQDFATVLALYRTKGRDGLHEVHLQPGVPVKVMLYQKAVDMTDAFATVGTPAAIEYKYDGFRLLIHKQGNTVWLFTRRLENVTHQFPDVVQVVQEHISCNCIIDGEVIGFDPVTRRSIPFQQISQRIRRKHDIAQLQKEVPVEVNLFDILLHEERTVLDEPFVKRRLLLESVLDRPKPGVIRLSEYKIVATPEDAHVFYAASLAAGNEGIMLKNLQGTYQPGARVGQGVKVKPTLETLQLVIVGAEWGTGKRGEWLSSVVLACQNEEGEFIELGRVSTGLKEKTEEGFSYEQLTKLLQPLIEGEEGKIVQVRPKIVVDVDYEEIQASPSYSSGYALRFPRFVRLREDLGPDDCNTLQDIEHLYKGQRGRNKPA